MTTTNIDTALRIGDYVLIIKETPDEGTIHYKLVVLDEDDCSLPEQAAVWATIARHWTDERISFQQACDMTMAVMSGVGTNDISLVLSVVAAFSRAVSKGSLAYC